MSTENAIRINYNNVVKTRCIASRRGIKALTLLLLLILAFTNTTFATPELAFSVRHVVNVNGERFKFAIDGYEIEDFTVRISKEIDNQWVRQFRTSFTWGFYNGFDTLDWNGDGYTDVKVKFIGNAGFENFLFLYDTDSATYRNVGGYMWYSGAGEADYRLSNEASCFYSFQIRGCAGSHLESNLYCAENYQVRPLGLMRMDECDSSMLVKIYRYKGPDNELTQIASIPMKYVWDNYGNDTEDAYEHYSRLYWEKHIAEFMR